MAKKAKRIWAVDRELDSKTIEAILRVLPDVGFDRFQNMEWETIEGFEHFDDEMRIMPEAEEAYHILHDAMTVKRKELKRKRLGKK